MNEKVERFTVDFNKPVYFGEYAVFPQPSYYNGYSSMWKPYTKQMIDYFKSHEICGYQWHHWGALDGETYDELTQSDSDWIKNCVLKSNCPLE